jgi:hypothetical protein
MQILLLPSLYWRREEIPISAAAAKWKTKMQRMMLTHSLTHSPTTRKSFGRRCCCCCCYHAKLLFFLQLIEAIMKDRARIIKMYLVLTPTSLVHVCMARPTPYIQYNNTMPPRSTGLTGFCLWIVWAEHCTPFPMNSIHLATPESSIIGFFHLPIVNHARINPFLLLCLVLLHVRDPKQKYILPPSSGMGRC